MTYTILVDGEAIGVLVTEKLPKWIQDYIAFDYALKNGWGFTDGVEIRGYYG